jgi:hypothetical protein
VLTVLQFSLKWQASAFILVYLNGCTNSFVKGSCELKSVNFFQLTTDLETSVASMFKFIDDVTMTIALAFTIAFVRCKKPLVKLVRKQLLSINIEKNDKRNAHGPPCQFPIAINYAPWPLY